jgi:hypothetical protein
MQTSQLALFASKPAGASQVPAGTGAAGRWHAVGMAAVAAAVGCAALVMMMPAATITGRGGLFVHPSGDLADNLTSHLAFQAPGWRWPLLNAPVLGWPGGRSIALTDGNPLLSSIALLVASVRGHAANWFGLWLALCWCLQPVAALYALRGIRFNPPAPNLRTETVIAVSALSLLEPAWLMRFMHINLLAHFLLLLALGLAFRMVRRDSLRLWWGAFALLTIAVLVHAYLFVFAAVVLAAPLVRRLLDGPARAWPACAAYAVCVVVPVALLRLLSGDFGADRGGYGFYSMNLLSPVWPQLSGVFGPGLPILDPSGGQYEGFNYLGAGVLLLVAAALVAGLWRLRRARRPGRDAILDAVALCTPLVALTLVAVTPNLFIGHLHLRLLPMGPFVRLFAPIQSSGRAFWPVAYALLLGSVALLAATLPRVWMAALLVAAVWLQLIDTAPERAQARRYFAGADQPPPLFDMPSWATLLRVVPPCDQNFPSVDLLRLTAVRQGMRLGEVRMARTPSAYDCRSALTADLQSPMLPGELRFFLPAALARLDQTRLGPGVTCRPVAPGILCGRPGVSK